MTYVASTFPAQVSREWNDQRDIIASHFSITIVNPELVVFFISVDRSLFDCKFTLYKYLWWKKIIVIVNTKYVSLINVVESQMDYNLRD